MLGRVDFLWLVAMVLKIRRGQLHLPQYFILNLKDEKWERGKDSVFCMARGHTGYVDWRKRCQKNKTRLEQKDFFKTANHLATQMQASPHCYCADILRRRQAGVGLIGIDPGNDRQDASLNTVVREELCGNRLKNKQAVPGQNRVSLDHWHDRLPRHHYCLSTAAAHSRWRLTAALRYTKGLILI